MEALATELDGNGILDRTCKELEERDAPLARARDPGGRVVSSVHRCKGAEAPNVAVVASVVFGGSQSLDEEEKCIAVVAATRHTECLTLIKEM